MPEDIPAENERTISVAYDRIRNEFPEDATAAVLRFARKNVGAMGIRDHVARHNVVEELVELYRLARPGRIVPEDPPANGGVPDADVSARDEVVQEIIRNARPPTLKDIGQRALFVISMLWQWCVDRAASAIGRKTTNDYINTQE